MILYIGNNLITRDSNVTTLQLLTKLLTQEGYEVLCKSSKTNQLLRLVDMLFAIIKYRNKISYIVIDTYSTKNFYYAFLSSQFARVLRLKYIPILHGGNLPNRLVKSPKLSQLMFTNSYKNIAPSNYLKSEFLKQGYSADFIPNVLDISKYDFKDRSSFGPNVLYVRAFQELYNPKMAIMVLVELKKIHPEAQLCMVGPDKDGTLQKCKVLAKTLGVADCVNFTGMLPKEEWHNIAEDYDVFVNTTTIDNTPVSVMEAMALGLPVVSTKVGGIPYLIKNNETGVLVESNDVNAMTTAIIHCISDPKFSSEIALKARREVEQFDWEIVKTKWKELLK